MEEKVIRKRRKRSFKKGWLLVPQGMAPEVRQEIMDAFGVKTTQSFRDHMNGKILHNITDIEKIEAIFHKVGITDIWGYKNKEKNNESRN